MFEFQPSNDGKLPGDARVVFVFILLIIVILLRLAGRSNAYCRRYHLMTDCIKENRIQSWQCRILPRGIVLKKNLGKNTWRLSQDLVCTYQSLLSLSLFSASCNKSEQAQQSTFALRSSISYFLPFFLSSFLPFFLSSFLPFFLSSFLPFFLSSFLPFFLSSFLPFFLSSFLPFFLSSFLPFFLSSFLPFFLSSFLPFFLSSFFLSSFLPFFLSSFLPFFLSSFLPFFLSSYQFFHNIYLSILSSNTK